MAMDVATNKKGPRDDINVTPLIDVVLVLLIIFMVLTPSMIKHLSAAVPKKDEDATPLPAEAPIVVEYTAKRELMVNGEPIGAEALASRLGERLRFDRRKVVFFKAEDDVPYGEVVKLMDVARGVGAKTLGIITK